MSLAHLDTAIAFAFIMLSLSLLVTIAVQVVNVGMQNRGNLSKNYCCTRALIFPTTA